MASGVDDEEEPPVIGQANNAPAAFRGGVVGCGAETVGIGEHFLGLVRGNGVLDDVLQVFVIPFEHC